MFFKEKCYILFKRRKVFEANQSLKKVHLHLHSYRDVPSYGVYIIAYEWIFEKILHRDPVNKKLDELPTPFQTVWVGGTAG